MHDSDAEKRRREEASCEILFNALNLVLLYLLVRGSCGRAVAIVSLPMLLVGCYWWLMIAAAPMPSVQGVALNLIGLMCWQRCRDRGLRWPIATGACLAASIWHHPLCGVVLAATIFTHVLLDVVWLHDSAARASTTTAGAGPGRYARLRRTLVVAVVAGGLTAPLIVHLVRLPKINLDPFLYVPNEMLDLRFALHAHAPLVLVFGIAGAILIVKRTPAAAWIVAYLIVGVLGQIAGYLGQFLKWPIPFLLPHEFQFHGQLALAVCAAVGIVTLARWSDARATHVGRLWLPFKRCVIFICLATLIPALRYLPEAGRYFVSVDKELSGNEDWVRWIQRDTPIDATFVCRPETAHFLVCGIAGRKTVALPTGHLNPAVDAQQRTADVRTMLTTADEARFLSLARKYKVDYLVDEPESDAESDQPPDRARWTNLRIEFVSIRSATVIYRVGG